LDSRRYRNKPAPVRLVPGPALAAAKIIDCSSSNIYALMLTQMGDCRFAADLAAFPNLEPFSASRGGTSVCKM